MQTTTFASRGRLDHEKGRSRLLPALTSLCQWPDVPPFVVHIYGDGQYKNDIIQLAATYPEKIFYHGRQSLSTIQKQLAHTHYALMPSLFLETFGLTALEALAQWVPVIGYRQGGLEPFIIDQLNLHTYPNMTHALENIINQHNPIHRETLHHQSKKIAHSYTEKVFIKEIKKLNNDTLPPTILMVSDYTNPLGGIETYLTKVQKILEKNGSTVIITGGSRGKNATRKKYAQMCGTIRNPLLRSKIRKAIRQHKPNIVRYHSVLRNIGHAGIVHNPHGSSRVTYHDLGLIHPFPSLVYNTNQIKPWLRWRISQSLRYQRPLVILKYLSTTLIRKKFTRHCDAHIVPSPFLTPMISWAPNEKVHCIGHFVD